MRKADRAAKNVLDVFSITNGGLPKFEAKWLAMTDKQKRDALHDAKAIATAIKSILFAIDR